MIKLRIAKLGYIIMSILFYAAGIILIFFPKIPFELFCIIAGIVFVAYGIIKIIGYFSKDLYCLAFQYDFAFGIFLMVIGITLFIFGPTHERYVPIIIGITILADSLFKMQMSFDAKKFGLRSWGVILATSIVSGFFGVFFIISVLSGMIIMNLIAGCSVLSEGIMNQCTIICAVKKS